MGSHHVVLGLSSGASEREIRGAYRRLALACHPDHNPGDPDAAARFGRVHEAYLALTGGGTAGFEPLGAGRVPRLTTVRVPLAHAIRGARAAISTPGGRLEVAVPACCGEGVQLEASGGSALIAHLTPSRFRREGDDLILAAEVARTGPAAGRVSFLGADEEPITMVLGPQPPRRIRLEGAGAPATGMVGRRGDLVVILTPVEATPAPRTGAGVRGGLVDALA